MRCRWMVWGIVGLLVLLGGWLGRDRINRLGVTGTPSGTAFELEGPKDHFLLLSLECRTLFDTPSQPVVQTPIAGWVNGQLFSHDVPSDEPFKLLYRVAVPEEWAAGHLQPIGTLPERLLFPQNESRFNEVPLWIRKVGADGTIVLDVPDKQVVLETGETAHLGVIARLNDEFDVYHDPTNWDQALEQALKSQTPAAIWVIENSGWVKRDDLANDPRG